MLFQSFFLLLSRHLARPRPAERPEASGAQPASGPAQAGYCAGCLGGLVGFQPGPCRQPGRLAQLDQAHLARALLSPLAPRKPSPPNLPEPLRSLRCSRARALLPRSLRSFAAPALAALARSLLCLLRLLAGCAGLAGRPGLLAGSCRLPGRLSQPGHVFFFFSPKRLFFR